MNRPRKIGKSYRSLYLKSLRWLALRIIGDRIDLSPSVLALLMIFDCCSPIRACSLACFFLMMISSFSCLCCNLAKLFCSRRYSSVMGVMASAGDFGFIDETDAEAVLAASVFVMIELLLVTVIMLDFASNEGVEPIAESAFERPRRIDELLDGKPPSNELLTDELSSSSVFFINKGLFS